MCTHDSSNAVEKHLPQQNQAASYFLLAVLSGILLSVSCLCGECIALKLAPQPSPPPPQQHLSSNTAVLKGAPEESEAAKFGICLVQGFRVKEGPSCVLSRAEKHATEPFLEPKTPY